VKKTFLMCKPTYYGVDYIINPHMEGNIGKVDCELALRQWKNLHDIIADLATVELIDQAPGLPDMVFTANAGLVFSNLHYVWLSRFAKQQRRGEERLFHGWFIAFGLDIIGQPSAQMNFFEGAGDGLVDPTGVYWLAHGQRSTEKAVQAIANFFHGQKFRILELKDPRFYHLDTCFAPLSKGDFLWYPNAFTTPSYWHVAMLNGRSSGVATPNPPPDRLIDVNEDDALKFACNSICIDDVVIMPQCSDELMGTVRERGYQVVPVDLSEFIKAGGAAKCLTLQVR
jgi:N-dimethylarginine dimethylaminohydrolase